jgi:hypothetical protein
MVAHLATYIHVLPEASRIQRFLTRSPAVTVEDVAGTALDLFPPSLLAGTT